jgi:hypothetical protein
VLFVTPCAPTALELDGSAEVFGPLNNPAACAELATDSVCEAGVNVSCGNADAAFADVNPGVSGCSEALEVLLVDALCVCWLSNPPFKSVRSVIVTDMNHLHVMTPPRRSRGASINRKPHLEMRCEGEKERSRSACEAFAQNEASTQAIDQPKKNFRGNRYERERAAPQN